DLLDLSNTGNGVWADSAYRSNQIEANLKAKGLQSRIHRRAARNHPLSERQKSANTTLSKVRARVEHVFGQQQNSMGGKIVRTIGIVRAGDSWSSLSVAGATATISNILLCRNISESTVPMPLYSGRPLKMMCE